MASRIYKTVSTLSFHRSSDNVLGLNLFCTEGTAGSTELHLNKLLVERGIARWIEEGSSASTEDDVKMIPG